MANDSPLSASQTIDTIGPQEPDSRVALMLSRLLQGGKDKLNAFSASIGEVPGTPFAKAREYLPGLGDLAIGKAPELFEKKAYGRPLTNIGKANVPLIGEDVVDTAGMVPIGKVAKGASEAATLAGKLKGPPKYAIEKLERAIPEGASRADYLAGPTVDQPQRVSFPDIYMRPDKLVERARVAPEDPLMKQLFGVTRADLYDISKGGTRQGTSADIPFKTAARPKGAGIAEQIMTGSNEQRLLDIIEEARKRPDLWQGMASWYTMDPAYQHFVRLYGPERAVQEYARFNTLMGMSSPGSEVLTEINRGTAANWLDKEGRFKDFMKHAGKAEDQRGRGFPKDMRAVLGHAYHKTAQAVPMQRYLEGGVVDMKSAKVPSYIEASGVPETGFQTAWPVGDAHWSRLVGLPDVRTASTEQVRNASASVPEMVSLAPWWRERIAGQAGLESVPAQAIVWGAGSNATGVTSPIGAPKLELLSQQIGKAARRQGISPEEARDRIFLGQGHAGKADPALLGALGLGAGGAALGGNEDVQQYARDLAARLRGEGY